MSGRIQHQPEGGPLPHRAVQVYDIPAGRGHATGEVCRLLLPVPFTDEDARSVRAYLDLLIEVRK